MTDPTPELVAGPKPQEMARERGFAPLGWLSSGVLHAAALTVALVYADPADRRNTKEVQEVVVDVVVDIPIRHALPSSEAPRALAQSANTAPPEAAKAVDPGATLSAAALPDRAVPVPASALRPSAAAAPSAGIAPVAADVVMARAVADTAAARPVEPRDAPILPPALPASDAPAPVAALEQATAPAAPAPVQDRGPVDATPVLPPLLQPETVQAASDPSVALASLAPSAEAPSPPPPAPRNDPSGAPEPLRPATKVEASGVTGPPAMLPPAAASREAPAATVAPPRPAAVAAPDLTPVKAEAVDARPIASAPPAAPAATAPLSFASSTALEQPPARLSGSRPSAPDQPQFASVIAPQRAESRAVDPQHELSAALAGYSCARVKAKIEPGTGAAILSGHVRSEAERDRLVREVSEIPGVRAVRESALQVVGDPYCRILTLLGRSDFVRSEDQRQDLAEIGTAAQSGIARFEGGTALDMPLSAPSFPSYIYVDYFTADGRVYHLLPAEDPLGNKFGPDERFRIGRKGRGRPATIAPPYGLDMIVAIAASEPIFVQSRPMVENASDYLLSLNFAVSKLQEGGRKLNVEYAYYLIYTAPGKNASN